MTCSKELQPACLAHAPEIENREEANGINDGIGNWTKVGWVISSVMCHLSCREINRAGSGNCSQVVQPACLAHAPKIEIHGEANCRIQGMVSLTNSGLSDPIYLDVPFSHGST